MSLGYADRLKNKRNLGGQLGAKEYHQSFDEIREGVKSLTTWVADSKRVFVFTGAGISTACGIPDFRGPNGIWTLRKKKIPIPADFTPFEYAKPSFTHMAIAALVAAGKVPYVCSQNVDSLHLWSGVPRRQLAELHGNCFAERCTKCRTEYARDFQMETVDFRPSGRLCSQPGCDGPLVDNILDWDTPLPEDELEEAVRQAEEADLALVLGTSLQIQPANEIPTLTRDEGGKMVIVNLQKTPKDRKANLIIRSRVDLVMALLMQELGLQVPPYIRTERLVVEHHLSELKAEAEGLEAAATAAAAAVAALPASSDGIQRVLTIRVRSRHGPGCPLPMVESLRISVTATTADCSDKNAGGIGRNDNEPSAVQESGGCLATTNAGAAVWAPTSSNVMTSPSPTNCSGAGYFSHDFIGVPLGIRWVRCTLQVRLVKWADQGKRDITLHHSIDLSQLTSKAQADWQDRCAGTAEGSGGGQVTNEREAATVESYGAVPGNGNDATSSATTRVKNSSGDGDRPTTTGAYDHTHTFVSQEVQYDPASVISTFLANPPPVDLPKAPEKKRKGASSTNALAAVPTRVSLRLASASHKRQPVSETTSSDMGTVDSETEN